MRVPLTLTHSFTEIHGLIAIIGTMISLVGWRKLLKFFFKLLSNSSVKFTSKKYGEDVFHLERYCMCHCVLDNEPDY